MEDLQKNHIRMNLHILTTLTRFNTSLEAILIENAVLSEEDADDIKYKGTPKARALELFNIITTRKNSYPILIKGLQETNQTGTLDILNRIDTASANNINSPNKTSDESKKEIKADQNSANGSSQQETIYFDIRGPHRLFTGRANELIELHKKIYRETESHTVESQLTSLTGLGGIGKTELSKMYIKQYKKNFTHIIWINAEREETMHECFVRLSKDRLGIPTIDANGGEKSIKTIVDQVYQYLSEFSRTSLLVFDNAENNEVLKKFLPLRVLFPSANNIPFVLITSRLQDWPRIEVTKLNVMNVQDAIKFVSQGLHADGSKKEDVKILVELLQCFPLAIQQAVAYIFKRQERNIHYNVSSYLVEYTANKKKLLQSKAFVDISHCYTQTTYTTWDLTIKAIAEEHNGDLAIKILHCVAYFAAEKIQSRMFLSLTKDNFDELLDAIELLTKYSMINSDSQNYELFETHRLVQEVIQLQLQENGREQEIIINCLNFFPSKIPEDSAQHEKSIWHHACKYTDVVKMHKSIPGRIIDCLTEQGKYQACHEFTAEANKLLKRVLDKDDPELYQIEKKTATLYFREGKYDVAIEAFTTLISKIRPNQNQRDLEDECLQLKHQIGRVFRRQGEYKKSLQHVARVIQIRQEDFGTDNEYFDCLSNQVSALIFIGDYRLATEYSEIVLENYGKIYGKNSVEELDFLIDIGWLHGEIGNFHKSVKILSNVYKEMSALLGFEHRRTLRCGHNLAVYLTRMGHYEEGYKFFKQIYKSRKIVEGKTHPRTMLTLDSMAECLNCMGKYEKAFNKLLKVHSAYCNLYGEDNSKTLLCLVQVAIALFGRGRVEDALNTFTEVLGKLIIALGDEHKEVCKVKIKMAELLENEGMYDNALKLLNEVLAVNLKIGWRKQTHPVFEQAQELANRIN